jgi:nitroreductase
VPTVECTKKERRVDVLEVVRSRQSIRAFKPDPIPQGILKEIMERSIWAPSWGNTQPWDFYVATGSKLAEIQRGFTDKIGQASVLDIARPEGFPEQYVSRRRTLPVSPPQTRDGQVRVYQNYGAPCVIYICTGRSLYFQSKGINAWAVFDCGLVAENIMLLATNYGLGTVAQAQAVAYPDILRKVLEIPESLLVVLGIAIGYPDWDHPANQRRSAREPASNVVRWYGF